MKNLYALLAILGIVIPYCFFVPFVADEGLDLVRIWNEMTANRISSFFAADVVVSSLALWAFIFAENSRRKVPMWWLAILGNLAVGVSFAFPLFLWLRERSGAQVAHRESA